MWTLFSVVAVSWLISVNGSLFPLNEDALKFAPVRQKRQFPFQNTDFNRNAIFFDNDNIFNDDVQPARARNPSNRPSTSPRPQQMPAGVTTVAVPGMGTPRSSCEDSCLTTSEYNPICADNGITYMNMARFRCAVQCGQTIKAVANRACVRTS